MILFCVLFLLVVFFYTTPACTCTYDVCKPPLHSLECNIPSSVSWLHGFVCPTTLCLSWSGSEYHLSSRSLVDVSPLSKKNFLIGLKLARKAGQQGSFRPPLLPTDLMRRENRELTFLGVREMAWWLRVLSLFQRT